MTPRALGCGGYGIFLIMGNVGFCPSAVPIVSFVVPIFWVSQFYD